MRDLTASGGERRWTAVVLADVVGSTAMTEQIGPENAFQLLSRLIALAVAAVEAEGGTALTFGGDSLLAAFGAPVAVEDASLCACRAALAIQQALHAETDALEARFGARPEFRIGISGGMVVVGKIGFGAGMDVNIIGQPVNTAARLQEHAQPGQILISGAIFEQVEGEVAYTDLGRLELKGLSGPSRVYALKGSIDAPGRFSRRIRRGLVDMVGREAQLNVLQDLTRNAKPGWHVTRIEGPPGIGKSRLLHDFRHLMEDEYQFLQGHCRAGSQALYQPIADILLSACRVTQTDGTDTILAALRRVLGDGIAFEPLLHVMSPSADASPFSDNDTGLALALHESLRRALTRLCAVAPTLLVIEDAHWMDGATRALIEDLQRHPPDHPCHLLITTRPDGAHGGAFEAARQTVRLVGLSEAETQELARRKLRNAALTFGFGQFLFEKSEGNPLFIEEILRYLTTVDALEDTGQGLAMRAGFGLDVVAGNLQHLVMTGVDALPRTLRKTLRLAAVQGRQFSQRVLERAEQTQDLTAPLAEAAARGLIEPTPDMGQAQWRFRHALLRDAIYGSLLDESRSEMHQIIAEATEAQNMSRLDEVCETLAYQFRAAQRPDRAAPYFIRAAHKALMVYDLTEVDRVLLIVRDMLRQNPDIVSQADLDRMVVDWLEAMNFKGHFARVIEVGSEFLDRVRAGRNERAVAIALSHYATALTHTRDYPQAIELARNGIAQAERRGDALSAAWLHLPLLRAFEETSALASRDFLALAEKALAAAEALGATRLKLQILYLQGAHYRSQGKVLLSRERSEALREFAEAQRDMRGQGFAIWSDALGHQIAEETEAAVELAEKGLSLTVPGTADAHVLLSLWSVNVTLGPNPKSARPALDKMIDLSRTYLDYNLIEGIGLIDAVYHLRLGQIAIGWPKLCAVVEDTKTRGNVTFARYFTLARAEILLMIGGLLKEPGPANGYPDRRILPPPRPGLRDIGTVIRLRFQARKLAQRDLDYFRATFDGDGTGALEARALACEALLCRNRAERAAGLRKAAALAAAEGLPLLQRKIEAQL